MNYTPERAIEVVNAAVEKLETFGTYEFMTLAAILQIKDVEVLILDDFGLVKVDIFPKQGVTGAIHMFYTLNDKWRNLKRLGSVDALIAWEKEQQQKQDEKIELEYKLLKSQSDFQEINTEFIKKQTSLIGSQIQTNASTVNTNANIKETNLNIQETHTNIRDSNAALKSIFRWTLIVAGIGLGISALNTYETFRKDTLIEQLNTSDSLLQVKNSENVRLRKALDSFQHKP
jgi:hypothetical protein